MKFKDIKKDDRFYGESGTYMVAVDLRVDEAGDAYWIIEFYSTGNSSGIRDGSLRLYDDYRLDEMVHYPTLGKLVES